MITEQEFNAGWAVVQAAMPSTEIPEATRELYRGALADMPSGSFRASAVAVVQADGFDNRRLPTIAAFILAGPKLAAPARVEEALANRDDIVEGFFAWRRVNPLSGETLEQAFQAYADLAWDVPLPASTYAVLLFHVKQALRNHVASRPMTIPPREEREPMADYLERVCAANGLEVAQPTGPPLPPRGARVSGWASAGAAIRPALEPVPQGRRDPYPADREEQEPPGPPPETAPPRAESRSGASVAPPAGPEPSEGPARVLGPPARPGGEGEVPETEPLCSSCGGALGPLDSTYCSDACAEALGDPKGGDHA